MGQLTWGSRMRAAGFGLRRPPPDAPGAVEMFARDGFGGTSTRQICRHLNLSRPRCARTASPEGAVRDRGRQAGQILDELRSVDADTAGVPEQQSARTVVAARSPAGRGPPSVEHAMVGAIR